jgi:CubicO group peptidase (beta-lactamase class C family)
MIVSIHSSEASYGSFRSSIAGVPQGSRSVHSLPSVLLGSQAALTQTGPENLNNLLESIRVQHGVPALAAAFVRSADLIALGAVGTREINGAERVQLNDRFHIGSCTKSMTATLIALLIEQGRLSWETTIAEIFPDLLGKIRPEYHKLTPLHFLSHRAGLPGQQKGQDAYEQLHEQMWGLKGSLGRATARGGRDSTLSASCCRSR